tara:strand:+ start:12003 stop:13691 length:1689 start_codon:yes stop_codon:yes gene_type:complete
MNGKSVDDYMSGRVDRKRDNALAMLEVQTKRHQMTFDHIITLSEMRDKRAERITTILSDYTEIVNQVSVVATLMLGSAIGLYSVLIGSESYFHPEWKHVLLCISSVLTVCFSITSVIESFFLGVRIDQIEARFVAGVYPHLNFKTNNTREFKQDDLKDINAVFNFILVTFFTSFISFAFGLLGVAYIGMGRSNSIWVLDERTVTADFNGNIFLKDIAGQTVSDLEPGYLSTVWVVNIIVIVFYALIFWRFFESHSRQINANSLLRFTFLCGCADLKKKQVKSSMFTPIEYAAKQFNELQKEITEATVEWQKKEIAISNKIRGVALKRGRNASAAEKEFYKKLSDAIDSIVSTDLRSLEINEIMTSPIPTRIKMRSQKLKISELEEFYDKMVFGGETYALINAAMMVSVTHITTNRKILEKFLNTEKPNSVTWSRFDLKKPYAKTLNFLIVIWALTGGLLITLVLFSIAVLIYFPQAAVETCLYGRAKQNICDFVSSMTVLHYTWLHDRQEDLVSVTKEVTHRDSTLKKEEAKLRQFDTYRTRGAGRKRNAGSKYYESISLKL